MKILYRFESRGDHKDLKQFVSVRKHENLVRFTYSIHFIRLTYYHHSELAEARQRLNTKPVSSHVEQRGHYSSSSLLQFKNLICRERAVRIAGLSGRFQRFLVSFYVICQVDDTKIFKAIP